MVTKGMQNPQFSYEAQYMGEMHVNMNMGSSAMMGDQRRASHSLVVGAKVIDSTNRTERFDRVESSQNTTNSMSSSQLGKRF